MRNVVVKVSMIFKPSEIFCASLGHAFYVQEKPASFSSAWGTSPRYRANGNWQERCSRKCKWPIQSTFERMLQLLSLGQKIQANYRTFCQQPKQILRERMDVVNNMVLDLKICSIVRKSISWQLRLCRMLEDWWARLHHNKANVSMLAHHVH